MVFTELQSEIQTLSRRDKYRLVQFIVLDLAQQESSLPTGESSTQQTLQFSEPREQSKAQAIDTFLKKWKGFLKGIDPDDAKYRYLQEKYQ